MSDILAIVGSEHWPEGSMELVKDVIHDFVITNGRPDRVVSGGAAGVDTWAIEVAEELGIESEVFRPRNRRWAPDGFQARNILIAKTCTRMLAVFSGSSTRWGSRWTAEYTTGLGKPVKPITL